MFYPFILVFLANYRKNKKRLWCSAARLCAADGATFLRVPCILITTVEWIAALLTDSCLSFLIIYFFACTNFLHNPLPRWFQQTTVAAKVLRLCNYFSQLTVQKIRLHVQMDTIRAVRGQTLFCRWYMNVDRWWRSTRLSWHSHLYFLLRGAVFVLHSLLV